MTDRLPPHSEATEQALLGCLLLASKETVSEFIGSAKGTSNFFYDQRHAQIFEVIADMVEADRPVDSVTLYERLSALNLVDAVGGVQYLQTIFNCATTPANLSYYSDILREHYVTRRLIQVCTQAIANAFEKPPGEALEQAEREVLNISIEQRVISESPIKDLVKSAIGQMEQAFLNPGRIRGLATGIADFDRKTHGLKPGEMIVIAGRPGMGKTSLAMNIVERVAVDSQIPVGVFSLEMAAQELTHRFICSRSRVSSDTAWSGQLSQDELQRVTMASAAIAKSPLVICDEGGLTIGQLRAKARRMVHRHKIQLLIVDYLQLLRGRRIETRNSEVTEISNGIKALAKELHLPVVCLSQLNRDCERDKARAPRLSDLRDSGSVEQDADLVAFIYQKEKFDDDTDPQPSTLIIRKQRNGALGEIPLMFFKKFTRFESAARARM